MPSAPQVPSPQTPSPEHDAQPRQRGPQRGRQPRGEQRGEPRGAQRAVQRPRTVHPVLERLAALYPRMFGAQFLPLKLGTYQDLMAAHPGEFEADTLKQALGLHTRSTRYLDSVARGLPRHDLQGQPVAELATEHVHHATVEIFKRKQARTQDDLQPGLRARLRELFIASGLGRADYASAARINAETFSEMLDQADQDQAAAIARREALMRAFEASGASAEAFADTYGMTVAAVQAMLAQARQDRQVKQSRSATPPVAPVATLTAVAPDPPSPGLAS